MKHYLGYEPIDGDYKVLRVAEDGDLAMKHQVLTLGNGNSWRIIKKFPRHYLPSSPDICIDGVLYYVALLGTGKTDAIISFDVRSEKLRLIKLGLDHAAFCPRLTNYEGKLALLFSTNCYQVRINLWVLEDSAKHKWSKKLYVLHDIDIKTYCCFHPFCTTDAGEIVLAPFEVELVKPFHVLYYHPEKNSVRRVYIEGITEQTDPSWNKDLEHKTISIFSGQVDNLMFL
ncbi:F-box protein [Cardamine amara subsp. amara]|uniref:F-box protein n=1 Tax=Cardamine amara subsp. amara TaxID=228776 RepID=A0ABD1AM49_CARAN